MLKSWLAALAIAAVLSGCGKHRLNDDPGTDVASTLQIVNHHWGDVDIYVVHDGQRTRVGSVTASGEENFVLAKSMPSAGGSLQLVAHAVGSNDAISSETIAARPGGMHSTGTPRTHRPTGAPPSTTGTRPPSAGRRGFAGTSDAGAVRSLGARPGPGRRSRPRSRRAAC